MKDLLRFEVHKIFSQKSVLLGVIASFMIAFYFLFQMVLPQDISHLYEPWEGPITQDKLQTIESEYSQFSEENELSWIEFKQKSALSDIMLFDEFRDNNNDRINHLKDKLELTDSGSYNFRNINVHLELLEKISYQNYYYKLPAEQILNFVGIGGFVILGALILIGISPIYSEEATSGVYQQMLCAKHGRKTIVHSKLLASMLYVLVITVAIVIFDFLFWTIAYSNVGWNAIIQTINNFESSPYSFDIGTYFIIKVFYLFIGGCSFAIFVNLISALTNNTIISFIISSFILGLQGQMITGMYDLPLVIRTLLDFSHVKGMMVDELFQNFKTYNFFGYPVLYPIVYLIGISLITAILIYINYKVIQKKQF